jgi:DNA-binding transcriptional MerR regulator
MTQIEGMFSVHEVAVRCGVEVTFVEQLVEIGVISVHSTAERRFEREVTLRVNRLVRLQRDLGVNLEGAAVIIELLDRIEGLERRLRHLEGR